MALTRFRLVHVEGIGQLHTSIGTFSLEKIDDEVAAKLVGIGSRYVEPIPEPEPAPEPTPAAPVPAGKRSKSA